MLIITQVLFLIFFQTNVSHGSRRQRAQALNQWAQWCKIELLKATQCACKNQQQGTTICCQNAPVAMRHKKITNYKNSYILLWIFLRELFHLTLHKNYFWENWSLCVLTLLLLVTLNCILKIAPGLFKIAPGSCQIPMNQARFWNEKCPWFPLAYFKAVCFISLSCRL